MTNIPIYKITVGDRDDEGIMDVSFVSEPAVEVDFVALKREREKIKMSLDSKKHILTGPLLIPNKLIYRLDENDNPYYITFSEDVIERLSHKMLKDTTAIFDTSLQHQERLNGNQLVEMWIINNTDNDKAKELGFNLPKGTLMASYKINDDKFWNEQVETGKVKGFSIEAYLEQEKLSKIKIQNKNNMAKKKEKKESLFSRIKNVIMDIQTVEGKDTTKSGESVLIFQLYDGSEVMVDEDGYATIDGKDVPAGEHKLYDGNILTIDDSSTFTGTKPLEQTPTDVQPAEAPATEMPAPDATSSTTSASMSTDLGCGGKKKKMDETEDDLGCGPKKKMEDDTAMTPSDTATTEPVEPVEPAEGGEGGEGCGDPIEGLQAQIDDLKNQIAALVQQITGQATEIAEKKQKCADLEKENAELKKVTPSTPKAEPKGNELKKMSKTDRFAEALSKIQK
jgi:hypothetical protein